MSKRLVAYFSASGVTAKVAENLADAIGADIFEIQPEVPTFAQVDKDHDFKAAKNMEIFNVSPKMSLKYPPRYIKSAF